MEVNGSMNLQARSELSRDLFRLGPIGPLWAHKGPYGQDFVSKIINFDKKYKVANKHIKGVKSLKNIFLWFCDKDLSSLDSIN